MKSTLLATAVAGLIGGIAGACLTSHLASGGPMLQSALAAPARSEDVVSASRIELRDSRGKVRAELAMSPDGGPALFFFDSAGRNRLVRGCIRRPKAKPPSSS